MGTNNNQELRRIQSFVEGLVEENEALLESNETLRATILAAKVAQEHRDNIMAMCEKKMDILISKVAEDKGTISNLEDRAMSAEAYLQRGR